MIYADLIKAVALKRGLTKKFAEEIIDTAFDEIKQNVLKGDGRNNIPQFGTFTKHKRKSGVRPVFGVPMKVLPSSRVVFRVSAGAKVRE